MLGKGLPALLMLACVACGAVPPAVASGLPVRQVSVGPRPVTRTVTALPPRVTVKDNGAWNSIYSQRYTITGSGGEVSLVADVYAFKIPDGWSEYDWYLISVATQTAVTEGCYQQNFPGVPFTSGSVGWYFQDSTTVIDAAAFGDGPLALEDYGPPSSPAGVTDSFTIGGGLSLSPEGPGAGLDGSFSRSITHPSVSISDHSNVPARLGSWSENFFCPHGDYSWWPVVDWPADESKNSHQMDYAVIVKVPGGAPYNGAHVSLSLHDYAYLDEITNNLVYYDETRWVYDLGWDGIDINVYQNYPPQVDSFFPNYTPVMGQAGQRLDFSVDWTDPDGTVDTVTWYLDDVAQRSGDSWAWIIPSGAGGAAGQTHVIKAVVTDECDSTTQTWNVQVAPEPWPDFSASPALGQAPVMVAFTDLSINHPNSWAWDFGDGGTSTDQDASHTYTAAGVYTVSLTVGGGGSSNTATKERYVVVTFPDVPLEPEEYWAMRPILACVEQGVVQGYPGGNYRPAEPVSRGQMAVYTARSIVTPMGDESVPDPPPGTQTFADVPADHWAYRHVEYCSAQGIVQGYPSGDYKPDVPVNRGQMAVYVARAIADPIGEAGLEGYVPGTDPVFPDVTSSNDWAWCYKHVQYCAAEGVVQGYADGRYHPERPVTRDQMAVYVARAFALPLP